jgi:DNA-directed RNA polymerase specialized sigma24 family protein
VTPYKRAYTFLDSGPSHPGPTAREYRQMDVKRMSSTEFEENKHKLRTLSAQLNDLARLILVEGLTNTKAAEVLGMSRQNINGAMQRVTALLYDMPADYVFVQEWMPKKVAARVRAELKELKDAAAEKNKTNICK